MAATYHLLCVTCHAYLSLGKVHLLDENGRSLEEMTFDGVYDPETKEWRKRDVIFGRVIEGFLIRHRNHELRFVPEGVDELLESPDTAVSPLEIEDVVSPKDVEFDPEAELEHWRRTLKPA